MTIKELIEAAKNFQPDEEYMDQLIERLTNLSSSTPKQCSESEFLARTYNL